MTTTSENLLMNNILDYFGPNWVFEVDKNEFHQLKYLLDDKPLVNKLKFQQQFPGYTFDLYKVGGVGYVIRFNILCPYRSRK